MVPVCIVSMPLAVYTCHTHAMPWRIGPIQHFGARHELNIDRCGVWTAGLLHQTLLRGICCIAPARPTQSLAHMCLSSTARHSMAHR